MHAPNRVQRAMTAANRVLTDARNALRTQAAKIRVRFDYELSHDGAIVGAFNSIKLSANKAMEMLVKIVKDLGGELIRMPMIRICTTIHWPKLMMCRFRETDGSYSFAFITPKGIHTDPRDGIEEKMLETATLA